jgi:hypothetical protein
LSHVVIGQSHSVAFLSLVNPPQGVIAHHVRHEECPGKRLSLRE